MRLHFTGWEKVFGALVIAWLLLLHLCNFSSAGALWRDEANSVQQAMMPTWGVVWDSLSFDSFPALYSAMLRLWTSSRWCSGDSGLRLLGLATGLCLLGSIWFAGRMVSGRVPLVCLTLLAADPVLISEGDSIRPYGISIVCLVWCFVFFAAFLLKPSAIVLAGATLSCVLAVQASYTNALFVGLLNLCAAVSLVRRGPNRLVWLSFLPSLAAAASLLPYRYAIQQAQGWASMLHSRIDWLAFLKGYLRAHSLVYPLVWSGFLLLSVYLLIARRRREPGEYLALRVPAAFTVSVALGGLILELLIVEVTGVAPFPRYFLPGALFLALALESALVAAGPGLRAAVGVGALLLTAAPTWSWLAQRHTNADSVAAVLEQQARPNDLVVISPWFLHTSFQRYYRGGTEWITVPELNHYPMMRYDLIKDAILSPGAGNRLERRLKDALASEGAIWFVSQRVWTNLDRREAPERPGIPPALSGADYVRFRSFWEREIEYRLHACCQWIDVPLPVAGRIWDEEYLMLTRWRPQ